MSDSPIPDIVLFNGGLFESPKLRQRLLEQLQIWAEEAAVAPPVLLDSQRLDLAVARGAAYYGMARRGFGERISAGLARTYYLGVDDNAVGATRNNPSSPSATAICMLPAGTEVDHEVRLSNQVFELFVGTPIQFPIYASSVRLTDRIGELIPFNDEQMLSLPPLQTQIKPRNRQEKSVVVQLEGKLTEIGTLELWCVEVQGRGRWRLDFDVRSVTETDRDAVPTQAESEGIVDDEIWQRMRQILAETFETQQFKPSELMRALDNVSEMRRDDWPTSFLRRLGDVLIDTFIEGRRLSPQHEMRWLNLLGYVYRPGFGMTLDDWRIDQLWRKVQGNMVSKTIDCRLQGWVLWRRVAGGLTAGQQKTLADPLVSNVRNLYKYSTTGLGRSADIDLYSQEGAEIWRLLGSLERLPVEQKIELGNMIVELSHKKRAASVYSPMSWALGRLGARTLMYGPLNSVVPQQTAEKWLRSIIEYYTVNTKRSNADKQTDYLAMMQLARMTGDRYRDIGPEIREQIIQLLDTADVPNNTNNHLVTLVREMTQLDNNEQGAIFGETLPIGLRLLLPGNKS